VNDPLWTVSMSYCNKTSQANMHTNIFSPLSCEFIPSLPQRLQHKKVLSLCIYTLCGAVDINNKHDQFLFVFDTGAASFCQTPFSSSVLALMHI